MNRSIRVVPAFVLAAVATLSSTSVFARETTYFSRGIPNYNGPAVTVVKHGNGTIDGFLNNKRIVTPYGRHALATEQTRDDQGRWSLGSSRPSMKVVRHKNGTTVADGFGMRHIQPYGKHAQPLLQEHDSKGRWLKAVASKVWGIRPLCQGSCRIT